MRVALIVGMAENGVIGRDNTLPWHLPADLQYFKRMTLGKPIIMGRKTFESIGRPLPGRTNIVLTRQPGFAPAGVVVAANLDEALRLGQAQAARDGADEVMVIGGAAVYAEALPVADRLYITRVHLSPEGDARFPEPDPRQWQRLSAEPAPDQAPCTFERWERKTVA
ncbi:MAG: dihydrofolate reductase [Gammaproteobacteria bacterium]|nr:MAG: dihydrofolate reductase [Gammaproteobacteria bacterium]